LKACAGGESALTAAEDAEDDGDDVTLSNETRPVSQSPALPKSPCKENRAPSNKMSVSRPEPEVLANEKSVDSSLGISSTSKSNEGKISTCEP
jgi:hypothetical protein